jgi:hypothetical protein
MKRNVYAMGVIALLASMSPSHAVDYLLVGKSNVIKTGKVAKFASKDHGQAIPAPLSADDPTISGATLTFFDVGSTAGDATFALDPSGWVALGNPPGSKGYKYKGKNDILDSNPKGTCRSVVLTSKSIKAVCKDDGLGSITLAPPFAGNDAIRLVSGSSRYCAEFGGTPVKNDIDQFKRKDAPAPSSCASMPCTGYEYAGACWFTDLGLSCDAICANQGLVYSEATRTVAGSDGTNADCQALINAFGIVEPFNPDYSCGDGFGCAADDAVSARCATPVTNASASCSTCDRICACE